MSDIISGGALVIAAAEVLALVCKTADNMAEDTNTAATSARARLEV